MASCTEPAIRGKLPEQRLFFGGFKMMKKSSLFLISLLLVSGCASRPKVNVDPNASLYERLGKLPAIEAVVKDFTGNVMKDERINGFFLGADANRLNRLLIEQICAATGGPCKYTGDAMIPVHTGMNITEAQFNALVDDLKKSLDKYQVPSREQKELLGALGGMKGDIINR